MELFEYQNVAKIIFERQISANMKISFKILEKGNFLNVSLYVKVGLTLKPRKIYFRVLFREPLQLLYLILSKFQRIN